MLSNQEILTKAIEKAIAGGWKPHPVHKQRIDVMKPGMVVEFYSIIFNHDFAKALWGNARTSDRMPAPNEYGYEGSITPSTPVTTLWQYHLQQMVIAADPIKYLGENIDAA